MNRVKSKIAEIETAEIEKCLYILNSQAKSGGTADNTYILLGALYAEYENTTFYLNLLDRLSL